MKKIVLLILVALFFCACGGSAPQIRYYQMVPPESGATDGEYIIGVEPFLVDAAYDDQRIVYRTSKYRLDYYHYHRWSAPPGVMISDYVRAALTASGEFKSVLTGFTADAQALVGGRVVAIEEVDRSDSDWVARISLELYVRSAADGKLLWSKTLTEEEELPSQSPEGVAEAMSNALGRIVKREAAQIRQVTGRAAETAVSN